MELTIEKLDHQGRGISHHNGKIIFIDNALPNEIVEYEITKETSKYSLGEVTKYVKQSNARVKSKCPFYEECGGCHLRNMSYDDTLNFKKNKLGEVLKKYANIEKEINIIKNKNRDFYRNKIEIQVKDGVFGFFKKNSHDIVEIDRCYNAEEPINTILRSTNLFSLTNGTLTVRSNYNGEIIISIKSSDEQNIDIDRLREKVKLVGIIYNDELIFGANHFIEIINNTFFKVTYNSFFQVNRYINQELFKILDEFIKPESTCLDLCSGVGTLSIVASKKAKKVYAIEIIENSVKDALVNAKMNKVENINFLLGDAYKTIDKIQDSIDSVVIDPPRSGLTPNAIESIKKLKPKNIIYISCDPITLSRDLKELKTMYDVEKIYMLDMFSYTYHLETICILTSISTE